MPFNQTHIYVTPFGDGWAEQETWQFGMRYGTETPGIFAYGPDQAEDAAIALLPDVLDWWANPGAFFTSQVRLLGVKVAIISSDGKYSTGQGNPGVALLPAPEPGTGNMALPQSSVVVSLRTNYRVGRARSGRCYLPPSSVLPADSSGQMSLANAEGIRDAFAGLLDKVTVGLNSTLTQADPLVPLVMSSIGTGLSRRVTNVRVGRVVDTQRRRRRQIAEAYTSDVPVD